MYPVITEAIIRDRLLAFSISLFLTSPFISQQSSAQSSAAAPQPSTLLQQSLAALVGNTTLSDITLTGTARRIAGSDDESGTFTTKAISGDAGRIDLSLPSGQRTEILNSTTTPPTGYWSGPDGVSHPIAYHNLLIESAWFCPAFGIAQRLSTTGYATTYVGLETRNGQAVQHVSVSQSSNLPTIPGVPSVQRLSQLDFYLDSTTQLPLVITFAAHPDNDALIDIPVEIRYSDYRAVGGLQMPYHIQKYVSNNLALDFQVQSVVLNSGVNASVFSAL